MENYYGHGGGGSHSASSGGRSHHHHNGRSMNMKSDFGGGGQPQHEPSMSHHQGGSGFEDQKRSRRSDNQNYGFVTRDRGSDYTTPPPPPGIERCFRPGSTGSNVSGRTSTGSKTSEHASSAIMMKLWMNSIYKNTTGSEPDEKASEEISRALQAPPDKKNIANETRYIEKLKIHLIKQGRDKDAKRLIELYQKLKGMSVVNNREAIIGLMYSLFDREATRAAMAAQASRKATQRSATEVKNEPICEEVKREKVCRSAPVERRPGDGKVANVFATSDSGCRSRTATASTISNNVVIKSEIHDMDYMDEELNPTPIPRLHSSSDNLLDQDMGNDSRVPSLARQRQASNKLDMEKTIQWDSLNHLESTLRADPYSAMNSISKISKCSEQLPHNFPTSSSLVGSTPNMFSSTPMDKAGANNRQKQPNLRKLHEVYAVSARPITETFNAPASGATPAQLFSNIKSMERDLIRDIVFILQGIDGKYIKSTPKGAFEIVTKQFVHPTLRLQTLKLCELGFCHKKITNYCDRLTPEKMAQGFTQAIRKELQEYYRLLAVIEGKVKQTVVDTPMSEDLPNKRGDMTLMKLSIWLFECRPRLRVLAGMVEICDSKRGGELCSIIHKYSQHGDPIVSGLTVSLLSIICKPLYSMLCEWILYGELRDPFHEFFIAQDSTCKREHLWHLKYKIRSEMLPSFISMKQAEKILAIGKNINFLKDICNNVEGYHGRHEIKTILETGEVQSLFMGENSPLQYAIEVTYKTTSEKVLKVLIKDSKLLEHLKAIKKYLLLGQGDFIQYFLELIQNELSKPASKLYNHNISAILESAIRATNSQFENEDILSRLDTRILPTSGQDLGWDVFCLDYKAHGPIGTVLTEEIMNGYNKLFNSLWRTKRIEIILSTLWKNQTVLFKHLRLIPEMAPVLHRSQLLISEMIHFVHQTQYYIMFEATEVAWEKLMEDVNKASDLDQVISSHQKFLETIFKRSLLDMDSRELLNQLRGIFDSVHELRAFLQEFNERVEVEIRHRKNLQPNTEEVRDAQLQFFSSYVMQAKGKIETLYTTTQDLVRMFLLVLNRQQDLTLQCLSFRLDFNEYYHQKDYRLSQPLTFQHRRLSANTFAPLNMSGSFTGMSMSGSPLVASTSIPEGDED